MVLKARTPVLESASAGTAVSHATGGDGMAHFAEREGAVRAREEWIDDLQQRVGCHDRDRV